MKKREDLEAIVDLLHEWSVEHGEKYVSIFICDGSGSADIAVDRPDYESVHIFADYERSQAAGTAQDQKN